VDNKELDELWPEDTPEATQCFFHGSEYLTDPKTNKPFCPICREEGGTQISCRRCGTMFFITWGGQAPCPKCKKGHIIPPNRFS